MVTKKFLSRVAAAGVVYTEKYAYRAYYAIDCENRYYIRIDRFAVSDDAREVMRTIATYYFNKGWTIMKGVK